MPPTVPVLSAFAGGFAPPLQHAGPGENHPLADPKARSPISYSPPAGDADQPRPVLPHGSSTRLRQSWGPAQQTATHMPLDDLVHAIRGEFEAKTAKITMKNGRTLTTLILTDGKWLSDTIWFK